MPRPKAAWRFSLRSITTLAASGNTAGSRLAAGNGSMTISPSRKVQPPTVCSLATTRAMVTGA
jgi:hypothetical protein